MEDLKNTTTLIVDESIMRIAALSPNYVTEHRERERRCRTPLVSEHKKMLKNK